MQNRLTEKKFNIPEIPGISEKAMEIHLSLYSGYVKKVNELYEVLESKSNNVDSRRRIGFELSGVILHEIFFSSLENGAKNIQDSKLKEVVGNIYGNFDKFREKIKEIALQARGPGWVVVSWDKENNNLPIVWVADHEVGSLPLPVVLAVDLWEHAYLIDYIPVDKGEYVESYLNAINWETCATRLE